MKQFQDLSIDVAGIDEQTAVRKIAESLPGEWVRENDRDVDLAVSINGKLYAFEFKSSRGLPASKLFATRVTNGLRVTNILPIDADELSVDEYNAILQQFVQQAIEGKFPYHLSQPEVKLTDLVGEPAAGLFYDFSRNANRATGRLHDADEGRWFEFLYSLTDKYRKLKPSELQRFLIEDGWPEDKAVELVEDFEYGLAAMTFAVSKKRPNA
ncbi:hypothetical protein ACV22V_18375 [Burkholderia sp. AW33-5]